MYENNKEKLAYCLYARKSSESDERQAMSIESQVKEMSSLTVKANIFIKEIRMERKSLKNYWTGHLATTYITTALEYLTGNVASIT